MQRDVIINFLHDNVIVAENFSANTAFSSIAK